MMSLHSHLSATKFSRLSMKTLDGLATVGDMLDHFRSNQLSPKAILEGSPPGFELRFEYRRSDTTVSPVLVALSIALKQMSSFTG